MLESWKVRPNNWKVVKLGGWKIGMVESLKVENCKVKFKKVGTLES